MKIVTGKSKEKRPVEFKLGGCVRHTIYGLVYICANICGEKVLINLSGGNVYCSGPRSPFYGNEDQFENVEAHVVVEG